MGEFLSELKRRHIYRVAAAYAVVAWILLQLFNNLTPIMKLPDWAGTLVLVLLAGVFPVALLLAWVRELPDKALDSPVKATTADWALVGILVAVLGAITYEQLAPSRATLTAQAGLAAAREAAAKPAGISLAVLPFANLSPDKDQEYFSDGMTEEITTALAKIPDLRVVGRSSAFQFKGQSQDLRAIGQALSATHLLEGSVRKEGNRLRISAELIQAENGTHVWTETYDRQLTGVFAIQEDIANAIAGALRMPLGLKPGEQLVANRNIDVEQYQRFLQLRAQARASTGNQAVANVLPELEKFIARNPNFAPAWAYMSQLSIVVPVTIDRTIWTRPPEATRRLIQPALEKIDMAAREAIRLDPRQAVAYTSLAILESNRKRWAAAEDLIRKALELDPYDPDIRANEGEFLLKTGRIKDALRAMQQSFALDPLFRISALRLARVLIADNQLDAAIPLIESTTILTNFTSSLRAQAYVTAGRFNDAADVILKMNSNFFGAERTVEEAARVIRGAPAKVSDPSALPAWNGYLDFIYGYIGAPERLMDYPERAMQTDMLFMVDWFANNYAPVRKTERFKTLVREAGLVEYWKARGWPDLCHPTTGDGFECR